MELGDSARRLRNCQPTALWSSKLVYMLVYLSASRQRKQIPMLVHFVNSSLVNNHASTL